MPKESSQFSRYVIPNDLAPEGICCVSVPVPYDPQWRAQFLGALYRMTIQSHYERDENKSGKIVAARWMTVYSEVRDSMGICTPSDTVIRRTINADFRLALNIEFIANGLDGIAPDRPDTFFDEDSGDAGDDVQRRSNALCLACIDFVNTIADDASNVALGAGLAALPVITPIVWAIAPIPGALFVFALAALSLVARAAFNDEEIRRKVACCMFDNLEGVAITEANFNASMTGCGFAALSDEEIIREILEGCVNDREDYLAFVSVLGSFMGAAGSSETDCACGIFEHTFNFEVSDQGWHTRAGENRDHGVYEAGVGWVSEYEGTPDPVAEKLYIEIDGFDERTLLGVTATWTTTRSGHPTRSANVVIALGGVTQDVETLNQFDVPATVVVTWGGVEQSDGVKTHIVSINPSDDSVYILKQVVVTGRGTDPF